LFPDFIKAFLDPDVCAVKKTLSGLGLRIEDVERIVAESYPESKLALSVKHSAKATLQHLVRNGILEDPQTHAAFQTAGLLD
jgi:hypothetical protein